MEGQNIITIEATKFKDLIVNEKEWVALVVKEKTA